MYEWDGFPLNVRSFR